VPRCRAAEERKEEEDIEEKCCNSGGLNVLCQMMGAQSELFCLRMCTKTRHIPDKQRIASMDKGREAEEGENVQKDAEAGEGAQGLRLPLDSH